VPSSDWLKSYLVEPAAAVLRDTALNKEAADGPSLRTLVGAGVDGMFYAELPLQYQHWPPESTTDGSISVSCVKLDDHTLVIVGMTYVDFGGDVFPFRATVSLTPDLLRLQRYEAEIGEIDRRTGEPPRFRFDGITIMARRDPSGAVLDYELFAPRRPKPIEWTTVLTVELDS
jgi:hypothetical protein